MRYLLWLILLISVNLNAPVIPKSLVEQANQLFLYQKKMNDFRNSSFTPALLYEALVHIGVQNPEIVFKQSVLETGWFTSSSFKDYNNPFGMKEPTHRETLCTGTVLGHGSFDHWFGAVEDYKMWQEYWLDTIYSPKQYYHFLDTLSYAEAKKYTQTLKKIDLSNLVDLSST